MKTTIKHAIYNEMLANKNVTMTMLRQYVPGVGKNVRKSDNKVGRFVRRMVENGHASRVDRGVYKLTARGRKIASKELGYNY